MGAPRTPDDLLLDRVVAAVGDRYEVERELGRGGMSVVYLAREVRLRRRVALKVLPPEFAYRAGVRERFLREAQTAAQLHHPHVVPVLAADDTGGVAWLAMAYVEGETLGERLRREGRLPYAEARRLIAQVADALAYAHAHGVVHRDVKPDNVLLDRESGRALVADFGIARAAEEDQRLTVTGVAVGTPAYMSPEQALGDSTVDGRSDQYALGVVAYQVLTGALPFESSSATGMLMKHVGEAPRPVRERAPDVPPALAAAVERALAKRREDRWPDAAAFRRALRDSAALDGAANVTMEVPGLARPAQPAAPAAPVPARSAAPAPAAPAPSPTWRAEDAPPPPPLPGGYGAAADAPALVPPPRTPPADASREMRRAYRQARDAWKEEQKELRRAWKTREQVAREEYGDAARPPLPAPYVRGGPAARAAAAPDEAELLEMRAEAFRRKAFGSFFMIAFLAFINLVTFPVFPWAIFPAWGMLGRLSARWRPLGAAGLDRWDVLLEGPATAVARLRGDGNALAASARRPSERTVRSFRGSVRGVAVAASAAVLMLGLGLSTSQEVFLLLLMVAMFGVLVFGIRALRFGVATRRSGIRPGAALSRGWRDALAAADPRPREERLREEARQLAGDAVLAGRHGAALLGALDDRLAVRETIARLAPADRALIPDVTPTVDALVEKVGALVQSLHRLDDGVRPGALVELEARLAAARAGPADSPDRERRLQLLERQRASLADLEQRRATLAAQLESAQLVLQNVKLDLMKLRASGVGALAETTSATQEARALSRDIGYALEAAAEVRGR